MKKKMMLSVIAALVLIVVGAYAATRLVVLDKDQTGTAEKMEITETVENAEDVEIAETAETGEEAVEILELGGEITEIGDGYIVIMDSVHGMVQVNLGDDTLYDGADLEELAVGQFIQVMYDGKMTRSLPPQVFALKVGLYPVSGTVKEVGEGSVTLETQESGEVIVFLPEGAPQLNAGDSVTAYTNGAMTMSLPAQATAIGVVKH